MLTNKKIRSLPLPRLTKATQLLASQDTQPYVMTTQKVGKYICINLFRKDDTDVKIKFRYFVTSPISSEGYLYNMENGKITNGYLTKTINSANVIATEKEAEKFIAYFDREKNSSVKTGLEAIDLRREGFKSVERKNKKEQEYREVMKGIRPYPKSFEKTIKETMAFSKYIFFDRQTGICICSNCQTKMDVANLPSFKEKDEGQCPVCGAAITYFSEKKRPHMKPDAGTAIIVKAAGTHKLLERFFNITYDYRYSTVPKATVLETYRSFLDFDEHGIKDYINYYLNGKQQWCEPKRVMYSDGYHYDFYDGELYKKGLDAEIQKAGLSGRFDKADDFLKTAMPNHMKHTCLRHITYYEFIAKYPFCEQLVKCGLYKIAQHFYRETYSYHKDVVDKTATYLKKMVRAKNIIQLQEMIAEDISYDDLWLVQLHNDVAVEHRSVKEILEVAKIFDGREEEAFKLKKSKMKKLLAYFKKQPKKENMVTDYFDYIENCKKLNYDMNSEMVLYPKNFKKAHDKAATDVKYENLKEAYEKIEPLLPEMHKRYDFKDEKAGLLLKAPDKGEDITCEGQAMHHCVGGYVGNVSEGKTVILFIRKIKKPDKPYVTMEVSNGKVVQVRAFANKEPSAGVKKFVEKFKREKHIA